MPSKRISEAARYRLVSRKGMAQEYASLAGLASRCIYLHGLAEGVPQRDITRYLPSSRNPIGVADVSHGNDSSAVPRPPVRVLAMRATDPPEERREPAFDRLARLTCRLLGAPLALVVMRDGVRQVLTAQHGLPAIGATESPIELSF